MKTRAEVARKIEEQMSDHYKNDKKCRRHHYGFNEMRELMDFIYDGEPLADEEKIVNADPMKWD